MRTHLLRTCFLLTGIITLLAVRPSSAQPESDTLNLREQAPKIYLDCNRCDFNYIRREVTFVNYVRDRGGADLHILVTTQRTGSGGLEYTMNYIGQNRFESLGDTLIFVSNQTDTDDERREGFVRVLKLGLIRFAAKTPIADQLRISYRQRTVQEEVVDKWNYWVFRTNLHTNFNGQESRSFFNLNGNFRANRITDNWKIRANVNGRYRREKFSTSTGDSKFTTKDYNANAHVVKSISDHWSVGGRVFASTSTFSNTDFRAGGAPAIEFNFFPYSESTRRELRVEYAINYNHVKYQEITIFDKTEESLFSHGLDITFELREPWGQAETSLEASNYLHDFGLNQIELFGELEIRLFKGFSLDLRGSVSRIRDQISLPKAEASDEDILLGRIQLPTSSRYFGSVGISYTFGSIFTNIVNPRFGF